MQVQENIQIRSNLILKYNSFERTGIKRSSDSQARSNAALMQSVAECETYSGVLKQGSKKRLVKAIELMVMACREKKWIFNTVTKQTQPFTLGFMTLTFSCPQIVAHNEVVKTCLEPFLQWLRRVHDCRMYLWKAELQDGYRKKKKEPARMQLHYHLTIDVFIDQRDIQAKWNELQRKAGYLDAFHAKYKKWNAPSTQIKGCKNIKNLPGYIFKEISKKGVPGAKITGKVWDCSMNLKAANYFTTQSSEEYRTRLAYMVETKQVRVTYTDHCTLFTMINNTACEILKPLDRFLYDEHINWLKVPDMVEQVRADKKRAVVERIEKMNAQFSDKTATKFKIIDIFASPDLFSSS